MNKAIVITLILTLTIFLTCPIPQWSVLVLLALAIKRVRTALKELYADCFGPPKVAFQLYRDWLISFLALVPAILSTTIFAHDIQARTIPALANVMPNISRSLNLPYVFFVTVVCAPIGEEILFRHFILKNNRNWHSDQVALFWTSFLFALLHPGNVLGAIFVGIVLGIAAIRTQNLWVPVMLHMILNLIAFVNNSILPEYSVDEMVLSSAFAVIAFFAYGVTRRKINYRELWSLSPRKNPPQ